MILLVVLCLLAYLTLGILTAVGVYYFGGNGMLVGPPVYFVMLWFAVLPIFALYGLSVGVNRLVDWILTKLPGAADTAGDWR